MLQSLSAQEVAIRDLPNAQKSQMTKLVSQKEERKGTHTNSRLFETRATGDTSEDVHSTPPSQAAAVNK